MIGAGVAGLAAIAAAKALGAVVKAFDTRPVVREQVESLGAQFLEFQFNESGEGEGGYAKEMSAAYMQAEQALIAKHAQQSDIVITTALIPGKPAPQLLTAGAVDGDGARLGDRRHGGRAGRQLRADRARQGGREARRDVIGFTDLPSRMARQASELYAVTVLNLLKEMYSADKGLVDRPGRRDPARLRRAAETGR